MHFVWDAKIIQKMIDVMDASTDISVDPKTIVYHVENVIVRYIYVQYNTNTHSINNLLFLIDRAMDPCATRFTEMAVIVKITRKVTLPVRQIEIAGCFNAPNAVNPIQEIQKTDINAINS